MFKRLFDIVSAILGLLVFGLPMSTRMTPVDVERVAASVRAALAAGV